MSEMVTVRDVDIVTAEIVTIKRQTQQVLITAAIELGRRLTEVKAMIPHGEWGKYLQERVDYSQSTADNLMKLYREYGSGQDSLFDNFANSQTFANLSYTQALALLSVPADQREQFAEDHDVANKSTREIQELVRKRAEQETAIGALQAALDDTQNQKDTAISKLQEVETLLSDAEKECDSRKQEVEKLTAKLQKAQEAERKANEQLKKEKENPTVPQNVMDNLRAEAEAAAQKAEAEKAAKERKKIQSELEKAQKAAEDAADDKKRAMEELEQMQKKLQAAQQEVKMANPDVAVFRSLFEDVQQTFNRMNDARKTVAEVDPVMGENLKRAVAAVLEQWKMELG